MKTPTSMKPILVLLAYLFITTTQAQTTPYPDSPLLDSLLHTSPALAKVLSHPATYQLQIIYTQINRDAHNVPHFTQHTYHLNPRQYFNPASLVKLPVALLTLEKIHTLPTSITKSTTMSTGTAWHCQTPIPFAALADSSRRATVGNYIKRMLLVSDNLAYNRLYEFLGQKQLNDRLQQLGYAGSRIVRRFAPCDTAANRHTNPIAFHTLAGDTVYKQPAQTNPRTPAPPLGAIFVGRAYQAGGRVIARPYEFTTANNLPLPDITALLQTALFPESVPAPQRPQLTPPDYAFLRQYLHLTPHGSQFSPYTSPKYFDAYKKYLYYGRRPEAQPQPGLRIFNIVGMSHGYLADVAYFADSLHQSEFLLSAVLYVNQNGVLNDGTYEYDTIGEPFLAQLGQLFYQYEARRPRPFAPNLALFFQPDPKP
ncbi:serine hydrolase [Hymenobacter sp. H14-R3]|uniref:serine hydrolase n=1 Tax=Hymenobacter sp. H14-R3 TaxID=3046308 RepID=UPI0024BB15A4|nr:serine hydrolase [Hymenobacter sp. H14-R3]MDJ0366908.1 serine hydrolase [Hymenobacter sp. H14-R3]